LEEAEMSQVDSQAPTRRGLHNAGRLWGTPFVSGVYGKAEAKATKQARRDALIAEWTKPIGGPSHLTAAELALAQQAAGLVMCRPRTAEDRVRCANLVSRILCQLGLVDRRGKKRELEHVPLRDRIGGGA